MRKIYLHPIYNLYPIKEKNIIDFGITGDGNIYWLEIHSDKDYQEKKGIGIFPKIFSEKPNRYILKYCDNNIINEIVLTNQSMNYHFLVPYIFPNTWILGNARSHYHTENNEGDKNIIIIDKNGMNINEFCFGDGINKIIKIKNEIWTSYFDEGVYGNFGWKKPIGCSGLVSWNLNGNKIFEFPYETIDPIDDCYAMNSDGENVYIHYYYSFPVVRIDKDKNIQSFKIDFSGSDFAIYDEYFLFRKAYSEDNSLFLFKIDGGKLNLIEEIQIFNGKNRINEFLIFTNGKYMIIRQRTNIYKLNVDEIVKSG